MLTENGENWLISSSQIQNVKIVLVNNEQVIFSYPDNKNGLKITNVVKDLINNNVEISMQNNVFNIDKYGEVGDIKELFLEDNQPIESYTGQMIAPITRDNENIGAIIFYRDINTKYPGKVFIPSKLESIRITKKFLEEKFITI